VDSDPLIVEFIEQEKLCPEVVKDILSDLAANYTQLSNGRMFDEVEA
jgi:hypothetical protein